MTPLRDGLFESITKPPILHLNHSLFSQVTAQLSPIASAGDLVRISPGTCAGSFSSPNLLRTQLSPSLASGTRY